MKKLLLLSVLLLIAAFSCIYAQQYQFAGNSGEKQAISNELKKEYLGLAVPDSIPKRFGTPELISDGTWFWHSPPVFSPDGRKMVITKYMINLPAGNMKIFEMDDVNGVWTNLYSPSYASNSSETSAVFTPDGQRLIFFSKKSGSWKLYFVDKTTTGWSEPQLLNFDYSSLPGTMGMNVSIASDGTMYFDLTQNNAQLCKANLVNGTYTQFELLPEPVNTAYEELSPYISPDQSYIMFISDRPGSIGLHDIYISFRRPDNTWTAAQNIGNRINSSSEDVLPYLSPDQRFIFFVTAKQNDLTYNAYWVSSEIIKNLNPLLPVEEKSPGPAGMNLYQNYPNPFNPSTTIKYSVAKEGNVKITVHNILGSVVDTILDEYKPAGDYTALYKAGSIASGVYFYKIESGAFNQVKKFVLLK